MIRTIAIKIFNESNLLATMEMANNLFNEYVDWSFEKKSHSKRTCHLETYELFREKYPALPSALIQSVRDCALESVRATKFKFKPSKKKWSALRYDKRLITLRGYQVTFSTIKGRNKEIIKVPLWCSDVFNKGKFKGASLCYRRKSKQFYLNMLFDVPNTIKLVGGVVGIDRGIYNLATTSDGSNYSGSTIRNSQRKYLYNRRMLQSKGTRSSKRRLKSMSGREKRFSRDVNHVITKSIVSKNAFVFALEDLSGIRNKRRGKVLNKWLSSWPFYQFEQFLKYKAEAIGSKVEFVDARYTSQRCSCCGHIDKHNRYKSIFKCVACGYENNADINASLNIRDRYILSVENTEQGSVNNPNAADLVASPPPRAVGG